MWTIQMKDSMKANYIKTLIVALLLAIGISANARVYLVAAGVADYADFPQKINNLSLTTNDAQAIVDLYSMNGSVDYAILKDSKATKSNILKAIKKVFSKAGKDDIVVFFFSGHGGTGTLCAADGTLTYEKIRKAMASSKCKNKMMFIDACHAGGVRVDASAASAASAAAQKANVMLFLSSRNNESSIEMRDAQNGLFTTYLVKGLKGAADANGNSVITAKELFRYVSNKVASASNDRQHPVMWGNFSNTMPVMAW